MRTDSSLTQLLSAHSLKHPPGLIVSLLEKIQFLQFPFLSFSFIKKNWQPRAVGNLPWDTIKSNTLIYPKDSFRSNFIINRYQNFPLDSLSDLMVYFNEPGVPGREDTSPSRVCVCKVIRLCVQVLVLAKLEAQVFVGKSWKTNQLWPVQGWIPLPNFQLPALKQGVSSIRPLHRVLLFRLDYLHLFVSPHPPRCWGHTNFLCFVRLFRGPSEWSDDGDSWVAMVSHQVRQSVWHSEDFSRTLIGSCSVFLAHRPWEHMAKTLCKHIG